jgi:hypothetical protein
VVSGGVWRQKRGRRLLNWSVLASGSVLAVLLHTAPVPRSSTFPLPRPGSATGDLHVATDRLRAALEMHRWLRGEYPPSLAVVAETGGDLLAGVPLDHYSYRRIGRGYELRRRLP